MGRRKGALNQSTIKKLVEAGWTAPSNIDVSDIVEVQDNRSDEEILAEITERFEIFADMVIGAAEGHITALAVSGSAGVGKTYTAEYMLEQEASNRAIRYETVKGAITPIALYRLAYQYRHPTDVLLLDDSDRIFEDEDGLNLIKALLDTSLVRKVSWHSDHPDFRGEDPLPRSFEYCGSIVFLTNKDFQRVVDEDRSKVAPHVAAVMSRSIYLDLKIQDRRSVAVWVQHIVSHNKILRRMGLSAAEERIALKWILDNQENLRELSIRTALKIGQFMRRNYDTWEKTARVTLLRLS